MFTGNSSTYNYGPDGSLVKRNLTTFIYAGSKVIAEYANGAAPSSPSVEYINLGGRQVAMVAGGTVSFNFADHLSTRVTADLAGSPVRTYGHFPAGETLYQTGGQSDFQFTSYRRDANSGLDYADARFYSSRLGRFLSPDPILGGGYAYANSDPVNLVDPSGRDAGMPCSLDPFHNFAFPLCGPDQIGGGVGVSGNCGFTFGDNFSFDFTFTSNCKSITFNFNDSTSSGPFGNYKDSLLNTLRLILPIDTCPAGTFECPDDGAPLFGQLTCDPRWCLLDAKPTKGEIESDLTIFKMTERYYDPFVMANCLAAVSLAQIHDLEYFNLLIDGYFMGSDLNTAIKHRNLGSYGPSPGVVKEGMEKISDPAEMRAENNRKIDALLGQALSDARKYPCHISPQ
jgi:RHS repeat-associated protein